MGSRLDQLYTILRYRELYWGVRIARGEAAHVSVGFDLPTIRVHPSWGRKMATYRCARRQSGAESVTSHSVSAMACVSSYELDTLSRAGLRGRIDRSGDQGSLVQYR